MSNSIIDQIKVAAHNEEAAFLSKLWTTKALGIAVAAAFILGVIVAVVL